MRTKLILKSCRTMSDMWKNAGDIAAILRS